MFRDLLATFFLCVCVRYGGTCGTASRPPSTHSLAILHSESQYLPLVRPQTYSRHPPPLLFSPFSSLPPASPARHAHTLPNTHLHYTTPSSLLLPPPPPPEKSLLRIPPAAPSPTPSARRSLSPHTPHTTPLIPGFLRSREDSTA